MKDADQRAKGGSERIGSVLRHHDHKPIWLRLTVEVHRDHCRLRVSLEDVEEWPENGSLAGDDVLLHLSHHGTFQSRLRYERV
jgi:hypothetical protein